MTTFPIPQASEYGQPSRSGIAVSVSNLSKEYRIYHRNRAPATAAEAFIDRLRHVRQRATLERFGALDDVSFEVRSGEILGIIGRNGAGKSTLLKILTRITAPTLGRVELAGRLGSLLEIGTGFHPELTGRENVYLNGTLLGMRRREIRQRFDEIVAFAGVERFLDTQVKRYSTGMYVRLAFAVAAHLETEILAVDEVLAVGDMDFQQKCLRKMREVVQSGRTVLLVSHQVQTVTALCSSAIYLERGRLLYHGAVGGALEMYKASYQRSAAIGVDPAQRRGSGELRFISAELTKDVYEAAEVRTINFRVGSNVEMSGRYYVSAHINNSDGVVIAQCDSRLNDFWLNPGSEVKAALRIQSPWLKVGRYTVDLFLCGQWRTLDEWEGACTFEVIPILPYSATASEDALSRGTVLADFCYEQQ